jgi:ETC complex I subunit conserved region.
MPEPDPENARFYHSGAEMPSHDQVTEREPDVEEPWAPSVHRGGSPDPGELSVARARIYRPSPNPMQSGRARRGEWVVEFEPHLKPGIDPLMGWTSSADPLQQVRMTFPGLDEAIAFCRRQRLAFGVEKPAPRKVRYRSYTENFLPFEDGSPRPVYPR